MRDLTVIVAALIATAVAQPPPSASKPAGNKNAVTLRGCLSGSMLTHVEPTGPLLEAPSSLRTTGSRAMRGQLKEVNGHTVELTGVLKGVTNVATGGLVKDTGKTKIYVGGSEKRTGSDAMMAQGRVELPTLDVSALADIAPQCMGGKSS
jgi:hypothetical protein